MSFDQADAADFSMSADLAFGGGSGRSTTVSATGVQNIDGLLFGTKWNSSTITISFPNTASAYGSGYDEALHGFRPVTGQMVNATYAVMSQVMSFTNLTISQTSSQTANIRLAHSSDASPTAYAYYPGDYMQSGDVWFSGTDYDAPVRGDYAWYTMFHEIGHALGLKHGHEGGGVAGVTLQSAYDSMEYSVMTYRSYIGAPTDYVYNENGSFAQSYMMYDIAALQDLYGADYTTRSGNNVYSFSPTAGTMFIDGQSQGVPEENRIFLTIWDGGGNDTYDFSNYSSNLSVDLRPGGYSRLLSSQLADLGNAHTARGNVFNALLHDNDPRSLIENARGGSGNDLIIGNQANNVLDGGAGNDTLDGGTGQDTLYPGTGNDVLNGNVGIDTAVVHVRLAQITLSQTGSNPILDGPQGHDSLLSIEQIRFDDGIVVQADGNAEVDDLFYDVSNRDVWNAHVDPDIHYNQSGWKEGRDPNALFDTDWYLAQNPDVARAHINPLQHFHQQGWREGRDPSPQFDTSSYLAFNPDIAKAGIDPLEHYLAQGGAEGRSYKVFATTTAFRNVTLSFSGPTVDLADSTGRHALTGIEKYKFQDGLVDQKDGRAEIDDLFYFYSNRDVWNAHVDPEIHYTQSGWKEGRNPNAFFDTTWYLAHNPDVAAAGIDPLEHYHLTGWREGRDPSARFDTSAYLAANQDIAAAHIDPLEHFLAQGIYEGRVAIPESVLL